MTRRRYKQVVDDDDRTATALTMDDYDEQHSSPSRNQLQIKYPSPSRFKLRPVRRHGLVLIVVVISIFVIAGIFYYHNSIIIIIGRKNDDALRRNKPKFTLSYAPPTATNNNDNITTNAFLTAYEKVMSKANLSPPPPAAEAYVIPLLLENNALYCRNSHKDVIMKARIYSYITMLNEGITRSNDRSDNFVGRMKRRIKNNFITNLFHNRNHNNNNNNNNNNNSNNNEDATLNKSLPIILIESDITGCYHHNHPHLSHWLHNNPHFVTANAAESLSSSDSNTTTSTTTTRLRQYEYSMNNNIDILSFPRLTWHTPALKYGPSNWCSAVDMPGFERYSILSDRSFVIYNNDWERTFRYREYYHPWSRKVDMAIWRGSTTGPHFISFRELPRTRLVQLGSTRPDIINAKFTSFVQGHEHERSAAAAAVLNQTVFDIAEYMSYNELMQYRAIIDIDGNFWSSRFTKLLCTNSVIIKVCICLYNIYSL